MVETFLPEYTLSQFVSHQLRWGRTVRDSRFAGYVGLGVTFGIPWSLLTLGLSHGAFWAWALLAVTLLMRMWVGLYVGVSVLRDRQVRRLLYLLPLRDLIALAVWIVSFTGDSIHWRGEEFRLNKGKLEGMTQKP